MIEMLKKSIESLSVASDGKALFIPKLKYQYVAANTDKKHVVPTVS